MAPEKKKGRYLGWALALPLALCALTHGMIHLMYVSGLVAEDGGLLGFNGSSWLLGNGAEGPVAVLVGLVVLGNTLHRWAWCAFPSSGTGCASPC